MGMEWNGMKRDGTERNEMEWNGTEWNRMERNGVFPRTSFPPMYIVTGGPGTFEKTHEQPSNKSFETTRSVKPVTHLLSSVVQGEPTPSCMCDNAAIYLQKRTNLRRVCRDREPAVSPLHDKT